MKRNYQVRQFIRISIALLFAVNSWSRAQMVYIPDPAFRAKLISIGYGSCITGDSIDQACAAVANTVILNIDRANINNLQGIQAFINLDTLKCRFNNLISLPTLPLSLIVLYCDSNRITSLPSLPTTLQMLICPDNLLTGLPSLPASLHYLICNRNHLVILPSLPVSLWTLWCDENQLASLPTLPNSLSFLICSGNQITALPPLPNALRDLRCSLNYLTSLPTLPVALVNLVCYYNQLTVLPVLPSSLVYLGCSTNALTSLPTLPTGLNLLECGNNQLTSLPSLPNSINRFECSHNNLSNLPEMPDTLFYLICDSNPNLRCLPQLKRVVYLDFRLTAVTCLPNYGSVDNSLPLLSTVPLCGLYNHDGCSAFWNITGKSYWDGNQNCIYDQGDVRCRNVKVALLQNNNYLQSTLTGGEGFYTFDIQNMTTYETRVDTASIPFTFLCPATGNYIDTLNALDTVSFSNDFSLVCKNGFDLAVRGVAACPQFRPAHYTRLYIGAGDVANFYGIHCATGIGGTVSVQLNGPVTYISPASGALTPGLVIGNTLTWYVPDFGAINLSGSFDVIVQTDTTAPNNALVCVDVQVVPNPVGDYNLNNNYLTNCFQVVSSFDPNDKEVYPSEHTDLTGDRWLTYTIRFQNTGTADAEHIYVDDSLSARLDENSFQLLSYSHEPIVQLLPGRILRFNFPNINLPDSNSNEPGSHGFVQFKIRFVPGLQKGDVISNGAFIYFDFNPAVATNVAVSHLEFPTVTNVSQVADPFFALYPNPARDEVSLVALGSGIVGNYRVNVFDIFGKTIATIEMKNGNAILQSEGWIPGIYFVRFENGNLNYVRKLVKE